MAVSADGFLARERGDRMDWLGATDKAVFRILTGVGGVCAVGSVTAECMPRRLHGRELVVLSRGGVTLDEFHATHPDGWLLGGPTLAMAALGREMLNEVHVCRSDRRAFPDPMVAGAIGDCVTRFLRSRPRASGEPYYWEMSMETPVGDLQVERWVRCVS